MSYYVKHVLLSLKFYFPRIWGFKNQMLDKFNQKSEFLKAYRMTIVWLTEYTISVLRNIYIILSHNTAMEKLESWKMLTNKFSILNYIIKRNVDILHLSAFFQREIKSKPSLIGGRGKNFLISWIKLKVQKQQDTFSIGPYNLNNTYWVVWSEEVQFPGGECKIVVSDV